MKHLEAFLAMERMLEERPVEAVRLATSALLAISFMRSDTPVKTKKGLPVYEHKIPLEPYSANLRVKPHPSDFLGLEKPEERVLAADLRLLLVEAVIRSTFPRQRRGVVARGCSSCRGCGSRG